MPSVAASASEWTRGTIVLVSCCLAPAAALAANATGLSSFEAIEEPRVKFLPATGKFESDSFANITDAGGGTFRFTARYNQQWWDGDRDTENKDRQRAEVKGLGPHQTDDGFFEYRFRWRSNPGFRGSSGFCHLFQLKAIDGDSGAPLITLSIRGDKATVEANPDGPKIIAREFPWSPDTWQYIRIRVKTSSAAKGELLVSVDDDAFQGKTGIGLARPGATAYRPKWGLYRRAALNAPMANDFVEHKDVAVVNLNVGDSRTDLMENRARQIAQSTNAGKAYAWVREAPGSPTRDFVTASIAALWAERNPLSAIQATEKLPASPARTDAMLRVFSRWCDQDVAEAAAWLKTRAPDPSLDLLVWLFVTDTTYRYVKRPLALEGAALIHDPTLRAQAYQHVLEIWARTDESAALKYLLMLRELDDAQKRTIAAKLQR